MISKPIYLAQSPRSSDTALLRELGVKGGLLKAWRSVRSPPYSRELGDCPCPAQLPTQLIFERAKVYCLGGSEAAEGASTTWGSSEYLHSECPRSCWIPKTPVPRRLEVFSGKSRLAQEERCEELLYCINN